MAKLIFNIMAICGAAAFSGVMLSVGITLGGYWKSLSETDFLNWFANNNQFVAQSIPAVFLLAFIGLAGSIWYSWGTPSFIYWLAAGICILAVTGLTIGYFVPTNTAFASKAILLGSYTEF